MTDLETNAAVAGNNMFSFSGVAPQQRNDLMDLLMYADYSATQTWRPHTQWSSWISYYRRYLATSGCTLKSELAKSPMVINSASELDTINFDWVGSTRISGLLDLARRSLRAARLNEYARHFFDSGSASGYTSAFQVVPCEGVAADEILIMLCALHCSATVTTDDRGGDWRVNREMVVRFAGGVYSFNSEAFAEKQERIRSTLRRAANYNINLLAI